MSTYKPNLLIVTSNKTCNLHLKFVSSTIKMHFTLFESLVVTHYFLLGNVCVPFTDIMALSLSTLSRFISLDSEQIILTNSSNVLIIAFARAHLHFAVCTMELFSNLYFILRIRVSTRS